MSRLFTRSPQPIAALIALCALIAAAPFALAHHGVAGLGAAGLEGPGAPVEQTSAQTLPAGNALLLLKVDRAQYEKYDSDPDNPEGDYANYWMIVGGYGFTSYFSAYVTLPYHSKVDESGGYDSHGFADMGLLFQLGFKYDDGLMLVPENESLDDQEDWHLAVFGGLTLPTGDPDKEGPGGEIDPGKSTGFGEPSFSLGVAATKMFTPEFTFNVEISRIWFQEHEYADGNKVLFGTEHRVNVAFIYRALTDGEAKSRLDLVLEPQWLMLGRDATNGEEEDATGGSMLYMLAGARYFKDIYSFAGGIKVPTYTDLNEEGDQQGAEGTEEYRLILSFSVLL